MPALFGADKEHEFLRRLRLTTVMAYTDTSGGHLRRERRGARTEFFGFNYNIALTDITGIFRGIILDGALASIMVELYIDHRFL